MKSFISGKQVILKGTRGYKVTTITSYKMEMILQKTRYRFLVQLQSIKEETIASKQDKSVQSLLEEFMHIFVEL